MTTAISDVMTPFPIKVPEDAPVRQCARMMDRLGIRHIVVVDDHGAQIGMVIDSAVFQRGALDSTGVYWAFDEEDASLTAGQLAERFEVAIHAEGPAVHALSRLATSHQDALVVVDSVGRPVGIVTEHDAVALGQGLVSADLVLDAPEMPTPVVVWPGDSGRVAYERMLMHGIRHVVVVDTGVPVGVLSFRDLVAEDVTRGREITCGELVARQKVVTIRAGSKLRDAAALMNALKIGCLPVVARDGRLAGVVTRRDLVRLLAAALEA